MNPLPIASPLVVKVAPVVGAGIFARTQYDPMLWITFHLGLTLAALALILMAVIVFLRVKQVYDDARMQRILGHWRPLVMKHILNIPVVLPPVKPGDWVYLFTLWNHLHESLRGDAKDRLNSLGVEIGLRDVARGYLDGRDTRKQILALLSLGNIKDGYAWNRARELVNSSDTVRSLASLRCLLLINPRLAMPLVVDAIGNRTDWSPVRVGIFLKEAGADAIFRHMAKAAIAGDPREAVRLLRFMMATNCRDALPTVRQIARGSDDAGLIAACLPMLRESDDLPLMRDMLGHASWFVRVQAATQLGRIGQPGDEDLLVGRLTDPEWWVRYRSAQALAALPFLGLDRIRHLQAENPDRYAREILAQVLAEQSA